MIDTIKFGIPLSQSQLNKLQVFLSGDDRWQWVQFQNSTGEIRFTRCRGLAQLDQHSYHREIFWDIPHSYIAGKTFLTLELSLPKFWYGHNIHLLYDFLKALRELKKILEKQLKCRFPDVTFWQVWRVDICYAWRCPSQSIAQQLLNSLKKLHFPYKKPIIYPESILFPGTTYSVKFYLKYPEFISHDRKALLKDKASLEWIEHLENQALGVLRYEATLRRKFLKRKNIKTVGDLCKLSTVIDWSKEFFELNPDADENKIETIGYHYIVVMIHNLFKESMTLEVLAEAILTQNFDSVFDFDVFADGNVYNAPAQCMWFGTQWLIHNGGGFTCRKVDRIVSMLQYFLDRLLGANKGMEEADEVKSKLYSTYKPAKAFRLYATWLAVQKHGIRQVKCDIGDDSYYRIKRELNEAGCSFIEPPRTTTIDDDFLKKFRMCVPSEFVVNRVDNERDSTNIINLIPYLVGGEEYNN